MLRRAVSDGAGSATQRADGAEAASDGDGAAKTAALRARRSAAFVPSAARQQQSIAVVAHFANDAHGQHHPPAIEPFSGRSSIPPVAVPELTVNSVTRSFTPLQFFHRRQNARSKCATAISMHATRRRSTDNANLILNGAAVRRAERWWTFSRFVWANAKKPVVWWRCGKTWIHNRLAERATAATR